MRLIRFPGRPARVSDDIRAALASLGAGENIVGGVALLGVRPPGLDSDLDAVLVLPRGVFVVVGVDLPDPAMTLDAPLGAAWTADGWPLVRPDDSAPNPAVGALALAGTVADHVHTVDTTVGLATIIAVGPFVETVEQPPEDLAAPVRVIHPSASAVLSATEALPVPARALTTDQARALVHGLVPPSAEVGVLDDETLVTEGFAPATEQATAPEGPVPPPPGASDAAPRHSPATGSSPRTPGQAPRPRPAPRDTVRRRHALTATSLLVLVAAAIVAIVASSGRDDPVPATATSTPRTVAAGGLEFTTVATDDSGSCAAPDAVGDIEVFLAEHGCENIRRGSFTTTVGERGVAVSVAAVTFADDTDADAFHTLAGTPGSGVVTDVAAESGRWPGTAPDFAHATYVTERHDRTVWLVLADTLDASSTAGGANEAARARAADAALTVPLGR